LNVFHSPARRALLCAAALLLSTSPTVWAQPKDGLPTPGPALKATPAPAATTPAGVRTINWDDLVPKDWDPMKEFKGVDMNAFNDADPRAAAMMKKLREVWDNAPVNPALVGQSVRIPGFAVPLEEGKDGVKEFLLVPYFGACVHSPPPPANQIIHVLPKAAAKLRSMDAVWITGTLVTVKTDSYMGAASYRVEATSVAPYADKPR
jgi:hypothetical protein